MLNLDLLLTLVGIILTAIGVLVLLVGKSRVTAEGDRRNIFEAFGIKLDVANPSVLLIMFGVVLMLTPRVLPLDENAVAMADLPLPMSEPEVTTSPTPEPEVATPFIPEPSSALAFASTADAEAMREPAAAQPETAEIESEAAPVAASEPPDEVAGEQAEAAAERARELAELQRKREAIAREQAALAREKARLAALPRPATRATPATPVILPQAPTASGPRDEPQARSLPRLTILTEALNYDGESADSLRAKLHGELRLAVSDVLADQVRIESANPTFRELLRAGDLSQLCKRTQAEHLLLADLTPVDVVSFSVESANWPNMRYSAVECASGRNQRSGWMRMEPTVGDRYPLQKSVARSAREFVRDYRHLLQ